MDAFWDASFSSSSSIPSFSSSSTSVGVSDLAHVVPSPRAAPSFTYTPSFGNSWRRSYSSSPRFFSGYAVQSHHFLDSCFLCKKAITQKDDIFMYRGDAPFCSEECRQQQIDTDEALESDRMVSTSKASLQKLSCSMKRKPSLIISAAKCGNDRSRAGTALVGLKVML